MNKIFPGNLFVFPVGGDMNTFATRYYWEGIAYPRPPSRHSLEHSLDSHFDGGLTSGMSYDAL